MADKSDEILIQQTLNGELEAFDELVRRYQDRVFNLLYRLCHNEHDAEDLAQEVFIKVYDSLSEFRGTSGFYTWLYRVATNAYYSYFRHSKTRKVIKTVPLEVETRWVEGTGGVPRSSEISPDDVASSKETFKIIQEAIDSLSEDYRMVVVLRHIEQMECQHVAEVLEWPVGTVKSRLHRARNELKERLREKLPDFEL
ncbi:MAG: sigma-70 family RNA polymerase sigma factor [Planctomycetota bacterium]|nr:sigma-70 family RNA polymerase sigma factor [Planctomycetota bacterium]MDA1140204.1 sigma-70 family RNA polymerase sigma factor [Planctomycetota bacterium]